MRSSIDLTFDHGNYVRLDNRIPNKKFAKNFESTKAINSHKIGGKDLAKIHNLPRGQSDLSQAYFNQNLAKSGVRRFTDPSEGEAIFNYEQDL